MKFSSVQATVTSGFLHSGLVCHSTTLPLLERASLNPTSKLQVFWNTRIQEFARWFLKIKKWEILIF